jgi:glycosyltransferase involved in cell wall biosynthesis
MNKPKVLVIAASPLHNGPRMIREIDALKRFYEITAVGSTPPHDPRIAYVSTKEINSLIDRIIRKLYSVVTGGNVFRGRAYLSERALYHILDTIQPQYVIVHNPIFFPGVFGYKKRQFKVIYNAHEYHPLEFDEDKKWLNTWGRYYTDLYKEYLGKVDLLINVCESIAEKCEEEFGKKSLVIPNAATYCPDIKPAQSKDPGKVRIIHHGAALRGRKIESMIEAVQLLGIGYHLDLMLMTNDKAYFDELKRYVEKTDNVNLVNPVAFDKIVSFISQYDIGIYNLPPTNFNNRVALPNKFFEFIQARLCVVISPSVEMQRIVEQYKLGIVTEGFNAEAFYRAIKSISFKDIKNYKENANKAAFELSAEHYRDKLLEALKTI